MTREEAKKIYYPINGVNLSNKKDLVDKIYDDFESRICKNCKLQYDKYCPIAETNHAFKYCSEWEKK